MVEDLRGFPGWARGRVALSAADVVHDAAGAVAGYRPAAAAFAQGA